MGIQNYYPFSSAIHFFSILVVSLKSSPLRYFTTMNAGLWKRGRDRISHLLLHYPLLLNISNVSKILSLPGGIVSDVFIHLEDEFLLSSKEGKHSLQASVVKFEARLLFVLSQKLMSPENVF